MVFIGDGACDNRCREALTLMRQTRLRQRAERLGIVRLEAGTERGRVIFGGQTRVEGEGAAGLPPGVPPDQTNI